MNKEELINEVLHTLVDLKLDFDTFKMRNLLSYLDYSTLGDIKADLKDHIKENK